MYSVVPSPSRDVIPYFAAASSGPATYFGSLAVTQHSRLSRPQYRGVELCDDGEDFGGGRGSCLCGPAGGGGKMLARSRLSASGLASVCQAFVENQTIVANSGEIAL